MVLMLSDEYLVGDLSNLISHNLQNNKKVLWLVSGGSCIDIAIKVRSRLVLPGSTNLTVALLDERYGPLNHPDSNAKQLIDGGFDTKQLSMYPILNKPLGNGKETASLYNTTIKRLFAESEIKIGLLGMGADGHTAGLLPYCSLLEKDTADLVGYYEGPDYKRVTATPDALRHLDYAFLYATGKKKWAQLAKLNQPIDIKTMPVQILKEIKTFSVYTDYKGNI